MIQPAQAAIKLNEIFINPPGTDQGQEFIELRSTTGGVEAMTGLKLIIIEGDTNGGVIDVVLDLDSFSTGTNGLFLWRDAASVINPAPESATILNVADFVPDIENGSNTYLIVSGFTGAVGNDLDTNNDGVLDTTPWTSVLDGVALIENDGASNWAYAASLGFTNCGPDAGFNGDALIWHGPTNTWRFTDVLGTNPGGPYLADATPGRNSFGATGTESLTPGGANASTSPGVLAFFAATYTINEGAGNVTVTVSRTGGSSGTVTVDYATSDSTAAQPGDYTQSSGTLTFEDGDTSETFNVPVTNDLVGEPDETFTLTLSTVTGGAAIGTPSTTTVTIQDNDNGGAFQFAAANFPVSEAVGAATITVSRTGGTTGAVSVNYATSNGTAVQPGDYTTTSGTLNFADGETSKTFPVTVINDVDIETAETVNLTLSTPVGGTLGAQSTATLTITSDDVPFVLLNEVSVNQPGTDNPYEYIELRGTPRAPLDGMYVVSIEGERTSPTSSAAGTVDRVFDLTGQVLGTNGLLVIQSATGHAAAPGTTVVTSAVMDNAGGGLENGSNSFALIHSPATPIVQGTDYDSPTPAVDDGTLDLPVGATLIDAFGYASGVNDLAYGAPLTQLSGTPDAATRFPSNSDPLSAPAWYNGDLNGTLPTSLEYNSAIASTNFPPGGALTPGAPNAPSVGGVLAFSSATYTANESALHAVLTVTRTSGSLGTVTVDYATANGTATAPGDFTSATGTLTLLENELSKTITIDVSNDGTPEPPENFAVTLSNPLGTGSSLGTITTATVTLQDSAGVLQLSSDSYNASEGAGTATITVTRTNGTTGSVTVDYATIAGTATPGSDYTETTGTLTLGNGVASGTFPVALLNDGTIEPAETVTITLSNPTVGAVLGTPASGTLLITDDDAQFVRLNEIKANPPTNADLPNEFIEIKGTPNATLADIYVVAMNGDTGVNLGKADLVFDLTGQAMGTNGLILIEAATGGPNAVPGTTVVTSTALDAGSLVSISNNSISFLVIYSPANSIVQATDYDSNDDGVLDLPVGAVVIDAIGWRDGGATDFVYGGVTLSQSSGTPDVATRFPDNNSAFSAAAWYNGDLLFGSTDPAEINYDINPLFLSANFPVGGLLTPGDTNAPKPGSFAVANATYNVDEGAAIVTVTVNRVGGITGAVSVNYATANGTAIQPGDYTAASGTLNFADGETSQTLDLFVEDDTAIELDETFTFTLSNPGGGATLGTPASTTITINDNDGAGLVTLDQFNYSVLEGTGVLTVTVNRFGGTGAPFSVNYATTAGTATTGNDYTQTSGTLTFVQDEAFKTFDVPITSDTTPENPETFTITLSSPTNTATLGIPSTATATIASDDAPALVLNELKANPPGNDNPFEYIEIRGNPGEILPPGTMLVVFEGDSGTTQGFADVVIDLGGQTLGSNGLLVIKSSTGGHTMPPPTTVVTDPLFDIAGGGLENGTGSFALWFSPTTAFAEVTDYDTNNDGTLEPPVGATLLDIVGFSDGGATDFVYGGVALTQITGTPDAATRFRGDTTPSSLAAWYNGDLYDIGNVASEVAYDTTRLSANFPVGGVLTPGEPNVGTPPPPVEIAVFNGALITDPELTDGQAGVITFTSTLVGTPVTRSFTIQNTGTATLTITAITVPTGFTALSVPTSVAASGTATFQVRFDAAAAGTATGSVSIGSDDSNENPFTFPISATATPILSHHQNWRLTYFGSSANTGNGADGVDPDFDGIPNLLEYALGFNPTTTASGALLPQPVLSGGNLTLTVTQPSGVTGITYGAEYSATMLPGSWLPVSDTGTPPVHTFSAPVGANPALFMRLVITNTID